MHTSTRTLLRRRQEQLAVKSTLSLTKKSVPELNDQPSYICRTYVYILLFLLLLQSCLCEFSGFLSGTAVMLCSITVRLLQNVSTLSSDPTFKGQMSNERPCNAHPTTESNITEAKVLAFCSCSVCFM